MIVLVVLAHFGHGWNIDSTLLQGPRSKITMTRSYIKMYMR